MTLKYESEILFDLMKRDGDDTPSDVLPYESELKEKYLEQVEGAYPKLMDYRPEWLNYNLVAHLPADFPVETLSNVTEATVNNVVPYAYGSAILNGCTKYRDIDTGEFLETFEEGRNLELVSVKMPVLTTSNGDGTKTNILTVNEDVTLRGIGDVKDELNLLTGELTQRIGEIVLDGSEDWEQDTTATTQKITISVYVLQLIDTNQSNSTDIICERFQSKNINKIDEEGIYIHGSKGFRLRISKDKLPSPNINGFKTYLQSNPLTVQYELATESVKTVDLSIQDQDGNSESIIRPIEGTMYLMTEGDTIKPLFSGEIPVEAITQNLASFIKEE